MRALGTRKVAVLMIELAVMDESMHSMTHALISHIPLRAHCPTVLMSQHLLMPLHARLERHRAASASSYASRLKSSDQLCLESCSSQ